MKKSQTKPIWNKIKNRLSFKMTASIIFFLLAGSYGLFQARNLIRGPKLIVQAPKNGAVFSESLVEIKGRAERISRLFLNGGLIFTDEAGNFRQKLLLARGFNFITLEARDQFGRKISKVFQLVYN